MSVCTTTWPPRCDGAQLIADFAVEVRLRECPGHKVMKAYWNLPEAADAVVSEWFPTGGIGRVDQAAYIYIVARKKISPPSKQAIVSHDIGRG
jgi:acyl-CoA synthetase (AMP-forming)/AMP-acid ligase II